MTGTDIDPGTDLALAYPWPDGPWLRAMMVMSLDGATVGPDGKSGSLSGPADRAVLAETRRLADVVLVGASTIRAERYRPMLAKPAHAAERANLGLAPAPVVAIVSGSLDLPWDEPLFAESTMPVLVLTAEPDGAKPDGAKPATWQDRLAQARAHAQVEVLPGGQCDPREVVAILHRRGLRRITCEGGAVLLAAVAGAGLVDELDLTVSPMLIGGGLGLAPGIPTPMRLQLAGMRTQDGFTFLRYLTVRDEGVARA